MRIAKTYMPRGIKARHQISDIRLKKLAEMIHGHGCL